ncbi:hypothetical protein FSP39_009947 [Pinctada imbricata]|uniref:C-type lectin domain-containing protein n=1 Tax=Pinctada imbricata TaxID=66713 RepID=A0AA89BW45_PINIB|nr:hypothetical protein FSP39_009947 [Pinctada imbricata]
MQYVTEFPENVRVNLGGLVKRAMYLVQREGTGINVNRRANVRTMEHVTGLLGNVPVRLDGSDRPVANPVQMGGMAISVAYIVAVEMEQHVTKSPVDVAVQQNLCISLGAQLVDIGSSMEDSFLDQQAKYSGGLPGFWIGGNDFSYEGRWAWTGSNRPVTYTNWYPGEPNNSGNEDCICDYGPMDTSPPIKGYGPDEPLIPDGYDPAEPQIPEVYGPAEPQLPEGYGPSKPQPPDGYGPNVPELPDGYGPSVPQLPDGYGPSKPQPPDGYGPENPSTIDGGWSVWKPGECSKTCGKGRQKLVRFCNNPKPGYGGKGCVGKKVIYKPCNAHECPVHMENVQRHAEVVNRPKQGHAPGLPRNMVDENVQGPQQKQEDVIPKSAQLMAVGRYGSLESAQNHVVEEEKSLYVPVIILDQEMVEENVWGKGLCINHVIFRNVQLMVDGRTGAHTESVRIPAEEEHKYKQGHAPNHLPNMVDVNVLGHHPGQRNATPRVVQLMVDGRHGNIEAAQNHVAVGNRSLYVNVIIRDQNMVEGIVKEKVRWLDLAIRTHVQFTVNGRIGVHMGTAQKHVVEVNRPKLGHALVQNMVDVNVLDPRQRQGNVTQRNVQPGKCSKTCGGGRQKLIRYCNNPKPKYGGKPCGGDDVIYKPCNTHDCAVDGGWSYWSSYGECSKSCGGGEQIQTRSCTAPAPQNGGRVCSGPSKRTKSCNTKKCPVDGGWSAWKAGSCSKTCGGGRQKLVRYCNNPKPAYGGRKCFGRDEKHVPCNTHKCPVHGGWSSWGPYGDCSKSCGGGIQTKERVCNLPLPIYGGDVCPGKTTKTRRCNTKKCPIDGGWSVWKKKGTCSVTCGGGHQKMIRYCNNPKPQYGGVQCVGNDIMHKDCNSHSCPVDGGWSAWKKYGRCSKKCGGGKVAIVRYCDNPRPRYNGKMCEGTHISINHVIPIDAQVNGAHVYLPYKKQGKLKIYRSGFDVYVETKCGLVVTWNKRFTVCTPPGPPPICTEKMREMAMRNDACGFINPKNKEYSPFKICIMKDIVVAQEIFENCVYDFCTYAKKTKKELSIAICNAVEGFAETCKEFGLISKWRSETFCPMPCGKNQVYSYETNACPATCVNPDAPKSCEFPKVEGCKCKAGYVLSDDTCVKLSSCGCYSNGRYYPVRFVSS